MDSTRWHEGDLDGLVLLVARPPSFGLGLILLRPRVLVSSMLMSGCLGLKWVSMRSRRLVLLLLLVWIGVILRGSGAGKKSESECCGLHCFWLFYLIGSMQKLRFFIAKI